MYIDAILEFRRKIEMKPIHPFHTVNPHDPSVRATGWAAVTHAHLTHAQEMEALQRQSRIINQSAKSALEFLKRANGFHSTVTLLARLRGLSTSVPRAQAV